MRTLIFIIQKEFRQIFRNKSMLPIIFVLPIIQLLILSNAASFEVSNIKIAFIDEDHSAASRELMSKFEASQYFTIADFFPTQKLADEAIERGDIDVVIRIPYHFEHDLVKEQHTSLSININAIDANAAGIENVYVSQIAMAFNKNIRTDLLAHTSTGQQPVQITAIPSFWYNKKLNYKTYMVPGILVLLVTMITLFLSAMNIVREKEIGTLEQINVSPIKKYQFIVGKLFPFWIIGLLILTVGLGIAKVVFNVPMLGNLGTIYLFTAVYLPLLLGMGLFVSNVSDTQQQAMFLTWFFMVIFILMSGLFTPIESMPGWAQQITLFNPIRYFVEVIRMVLLKGAGLHAVQKHFAVIAGYAVVMNFLAVWSYKKTV